MILKVLSRDGNDGTALFGRGVYEWGCFDAGLSGSARFTVNADASGLALDVVKEGSLVHIFPQHGFEHWLGLISDPPTKDLQTNTVQINALELTTFLGEIENDDRLATQYVDLAYAAWRAFRTSAGAGWGMQVSTIAPASCGALRKEHGLRGRTLAAVAQALGEAGRVNGVKVTPHAGGYMLVEVGLAQLDDYQGALIAPMNVREESSQSAGHGVSEVTAEGGGEFAVAADPGARFPGRRIVSAPSGGVGKAAQQQLSSLSRSATTIRLRASASQLGSVRPGMIAPYVRADREGAPGAYVRVVSLAVDESLLPTEFLLTVQVVEPNAVSGTRLRGGPFWPGVRGTGSAYMRRLQRQQNA